MDDITRIQRCFARKAKAQPAYRFRDLCSLVWKPSFLEVALDQVLANKGSRSADIDGVSIKDFRDPTYREQFIQTSLRNSKARRSGHHLGVACTFPRAAADGDPWAS
jgi:retron-type reverse transcriptase